MAEVVILKRKMPKENTFGVQPFLGETPETPMAGSPNSLPGRLDSQLDENPIGIHLCKYLGFKIG